MKFKSLNSTHIIKIHNILVDVYKISNGYADKGKLDALLYKIDFLHDDDILKRSSILLEGLIRLHAFTDGNKRTALESVKTYLNLNDYYLIFPLSTVAFSYKIANTQKIDPKSNEDLINEITWWLKKFCVSKDDKNKINALFLLYYTIPTKLIHFFIKIKLPKIGNFILKKYIQMNVKDMNKNMIDFILNLLIDQLTSFEKKMSDKD